jgi:hypothetical protein
MTFTCLKKSSSEMLYFFAQSCSKKKCDNSCILVNIGTFVLDLFLYSEKLEGKLRKIYGQAVTIQLD